MNQQAIEARRHVPKDSQAIRFDDLPGAVVYLYGTTKANWICAVGYRPRAYNAAFANRYRTTEQRDKAVAQFFDGLRANAAYKAERKATRTASDEQSPADRLRAKLKAAGYNARRVTVRHDHYSMGSSIDVTIRDPDVGRDTIKALASEFERVDRCEITGEILSGGNRYLDVKYSGKATATLRDRVRRVVMAAIEKAKAIDPGQLVPVNDDWLIGRPTDNRHGLRLWDRRESARHHVRDAYNDEAAVSIVAGA